MAPVGLLAGGVRRARGRARRRVARSNPRSRSTSSASTPRGSPSSSTAWGPRFFEGRHSIGRLVVGGRGVPTPMARARSTTSTRSGPARTTWRPRCRRVSPVPVVKVTTPVAIAPFEPLSRERLGLPGGLRVPVRVRLQQRRSERKNPLGAIAAFARAFEPGEGASLVLKCVGSERFAADHEQLLAAAAEHPDVHVIDRPLPSAEKNALRRRLRLLRLASSRRGVRSPPGRGDGARKARDRDRLLRQPRLHDRREQLARGLLAASRSARAPSRTRRRGSGPSPTSTTPPD